MIYSDSVDIKYEEQTPDGSGGFTTTTKTRASGVSCDFRKRNEIATQRKQEIIGDTTEVRYNYLLFVPPGTSYKDTDFIMYDSTEYKITGSVDGRIRKILTLKER